MITEIDSMESQTGWDGSGGASVEREVLYPELIADNREKSLMFYFDGGGTVSKTLADPVDVSEREEIVLSIWSRDFRKHRYVGTSDYAYKLQINGEHEWYIPVYSVFSSITVQIPDEVSEIASVAILANHSGNDFIVVSAMYAVRDEYPLDIMTGVQRGIEQVRETLYPDGLVLGTVNASAGDRSLSIEWSRDYIDRYSVVRIQNGDGDEEFHQIESKDSSSVRFTDLYDGATITHEHSDSVLSLWFPVEYHRYSMEAIVPGIVVFTMAPEPVLSDSEIEQVRDNRRDGTWDVRRAPQELTYPVLITCQGIGMPNAMQNRIIRWFLASNRVWINGRLHGIEWQSAPDVVEPTDDAESIGAQVQYQLDVRVREERSRRDTVSTAGPATPTIEARRV